MKKGFSMLELVIAMAILGAFLLPFILHFAHVKRTSMAARDTVSANAFLSSCLGEIQALPFADLTIGPRDGVSTLSRLLSRYEGVKTMGPVTLDTTIVISRGADPRLRIIDLKTAFRLPGTSAGKTDRQLTMRGFRCERP